MAVCSNGADELFSLVYDAVVGSYELVSRDTYECVEISTSSNALYTSPCDGDSRQAWLRVLAAGIDYSFHSHHNGNCLEGSSGTVSHRPCTSSPSQRWRMVAVP